MSAQSLLTDELRRAIGYETTPTTIEIDRTVIKRFAEAVDDPNPRWRDSAPPSLFASSMMAGEQAAAQIQAILPARALDGGGEFEFLLPVEPGDSITVTARLTDIVERQSRLGPMLVVSSKLTWRNQRGEVVAQANNSMIRY